MRSLLLALMVCACATASDGAPSAAPVVAAERAFAARAGEIGWVGAFREYATADAQMGAPGFPNAQAQLAAVADDGNRDLQWWPAFAGIARSGDLGFTTGPVSFDAARTPRMHYFTVWRRRADGTWRWIYDGGVGPIENANLIARDAAVVPELPVAAAGVGAQRAVAEVRALEEAGGLARYLAGDAPVFRTRQSRGQGPEAFNVPSAVAVYTPVRIEASEAGDLVMVIGEVRWEGGQGLYGRMWQHQPDGWRIVYDQLSLPPPPRAG